MEGKVNLKNIDPALLGSEESIPAAMSGAVDEGNVDKMDLDTTDEVPAAEDAAPTDNDAMLPWRQSLAAAGLAGFDEETEAEIDRLVAQIPLGVLRNQWIEAEDKLLVLLRKQEHARSYKEIHSVSKHLAFSPTSSYVISANICLFHLTSMLKDACTNCCSSSCGNNHPSASRAWTNALFAPALHSSASCFWVRDSPVSSEKERISPRLTRGGFMLEDMGIVWWKHGEIHTHLS